MTISKSPPYINIKGATICAWHHGKPSIRHIKDRQVARTIIALVENIKAGVTLLELNNIFAVRESRYMSDLEHKYNITIGMQEELTSCGWHGRYFLETPVDVIEVHYTDNE